MANYEVFISFKNTDKFGNSTTDAKMAEQLYYALEKKNIRTFYSNISIQKTAVSKFAQEIDKALEQCSILVAVGTSAEHLESAWVYDEIDTFRNEMLNGNKAEGKSAIISYISEDLPHNKLPLVLRKCQSFYDMDLLVEFIVNHRNSKGGLESTKAPVISTEFKAELHPGDMVLDRYKIIRKIGKGGMSVVYAALDILTQKTVAVKIITFNNLQFNDTVIRGLTFEAELIQRLNHPCIPKIYETKLTDSSFTMVMDFIDGRMLDTCVAEDKPMDEQSIRNIARQLGEILCHLHTQKPQIIYRDLKPANIALKPDGDITLFDFGIAREYNENNLSDTTCLGTIGYAAPEQYGGMGQTDARTDIYGLGMTLYHLATGQNPGKCFSGASPVCEINPQISVGLSYIIEKCTQKDPDDRFQSAAEFLDTLRKIDKIKNKGLLSIFSQDKKKKRRQKQNIKKLPIPAPPVSDQNINPPKPIPVPHKPNSFVSQVIPVSTVNIPVESACETTILGNIADDFSTILLTEEYLCTAVNEKAELDIESSAEADICVIGFCNSENSLQMLHILIEDNSPSSVLERMNEQAPEEKVVFCTQKFEVKAGDILTLLYKEENTVCRYMWTGSASEDFTELPDTATASDAEFTVLHNQECRISNCNLQDIKLPSAVRQQTEDSVMKLKGIRNILQDRILGHDSEINEIIRCHLKAILQSEIRKNSSAPLAVYIFAGPSGTGKVYTAQCLSGLLKLPYKCISADECLFAEKSRSELSALISDFTKSNPECMIIIEGTEKADKELISFAISLAEGNEKTNTAKSIVVITVNTNTVPADTTKSSLIKNLINEGIPEALLRKVEEENIIFFGSIPAHALKDIIKRELLLSASALEKETDIEISFDEAVFSVLLLVNALSADAGTVHSFAKSFFFNKISELLLEAGTEQLPVSISDIKRIHFTAENHKGFSEDNPEQRIADMKKNGTVLSFSVDRTFIPEEGKVQIILTDFSI